MITGARMNKPKQYSSGTVLTVV